MKLLLLTLFLAAAGFAQGTPYDCLSVFSFSAVSVQPGVNNASAGSPCVAWRVTYTSSGFSSATVKFQTSPDNSSWSDVTNSICSSSVQPPCVTDGANPLAAGVMGSSSFRAYGKYVRVNVTSVTGSGSGQVVVYGYKGTSASAALGGGGSSGGGTPGIAFVTASLCDGVADATSDIQGKLNDSTVGTVYIPAGNCLFSGITIPAGKRLECVGGTNYFGSASIATLTYTGSGVAITGAWSSGTQQRMVIENCTIVKQGSVGGTAIQSFASLRSVFQGNQINGFTNGILLKGSISPGVYNDALRDNSIYGTTNAITSDFSSSNTANAILVQNNTVTLSNRAIEACAHCDSWHIEKNDLECFTGSSAYGIFIQSGGHSHTVISNWVEDNVCNTADHTNGIWAQGNQVVINNSLPTRDSNTWTNITYNILTAVFNPFYTNSSGDIIPQFFLPTVRINEYTVSTLPASPFGGQRAGVTDALNPVFGSTVVGGGAVVVPVYYNGTNWIVG